LLYLLIAAVVLVAVTSIIALREAHARLARSSERFLDALTTSSDRNQANTEAVMAQLAATHAAHREEVQGLLQRIQAPELAVIQYQQDTASSDESYPLTDEETARIQEEQLALERIERMEREGVLS
jgi:hypothetical protein